MPKEVDRVMPRLAGVWQDQKEAKGMAAGGQVGDYKEVRDN